MKVKFGIAVLSSIALLLIATVIVQGQQKAAVAMSPLDAVRAGGPITFTVTLNQPLPAGAHFDLRVSPVSADEELDLGSGQPVKDSATTFRVVGNMPQNAVPGEWHISVVWFFLPGAGWTHNSLATNDLRFHVAGNAYPIPTRADVVLQK